MKKTILLLCFCGYFLLSLNLSLAYSENENSQNGPTDPVARMKSWEHHLRLKNESIFRNLKWRAVGPMFQGGRIESIACPSGINTTIYVGTDDGNVFVTRDDGVSWTEINTGLPRKWVSRVVASCYDEGTVYVSLTGYREDDFKRYLYMSTDFGKT